MTCCPGTILPFVMQSVTTIGYSGIAPQLVVYYQDGTEYVLGEEGGIIYADNLITIDHGGPQTGFVKYL